MFFDITLTVLAAAIIVLLVLVLRKIGQGGKTLGDKDSELLRNLFSSEFASFDKLISGNIERTNSAFITDINKSIKKIDEEINKLKDKLSENHINLIEKLSSSLKEMSSEAEKHNEKSMKNLNDKFEQFSKSTGEKLSGIDESVVKSLSELRRQNNEKLDAIQKTVDERLQKTLEGRLKQSFDNVVEQISNVNKAIGEIKGIASDVGSLKNVLTNVKTKGIVGEVILGNIIREMLTKDQYEENIATKKGSRDVVEFAIKMPGGNREFVYLPIDSKFPLESYHIIKDGIEEGDKAKTEKGRKDLRANIKKFAKDISQKYIDSPRTTDFAIMFLPVEGLYAEVIESGVFEEIQRDYKVNAVGPSTLAALLNALQMGFKSYVIQKRSGEVFNLLSEIKKEFSKFADVLSKAQTKVGEVGEELDRLVGIRTKKIQKKLNDISALPGEASDDRDAPQE